MFRQLLICTAIVLLSQMVSSDEPTSADAVSPESSVIRLVDGSVIEFRLITKVGSAFLITLANGSMVSYRQEDIDSSSLPSEFQPSTTESYHKPGNPTVLRESKQNDRLGDRKLNGSAGEKASDEGIVIQITGDGSISPASTNDDYERRRKDALNRIEELAKVNAEGAAKLSKNMREYVNACFGTTVTRHKTETSGIGLTQGEVWGEYRGGYFEADLNAVTFWTQESNTTSESANADTPYCRGLWGEIKGLYTVIGPQFTSAIINARLSYVLDSETNAVLGRYGIAGTDVWMIR